MKPQRQFLSKQTDGRTRGHAAANKTKSFLKKKFWKHAAAEQRREVRVGCELGFYDFTNHQTDLLNSVSKINIPENIFFPIYDLVLLLPFS